MASHAWRPTGTCAASCNAFYVGALTGPTNFQYLLLLSLQYLRFIPHTAPHMTYAAAVDLASCCPVLLQVCQC
jgi:hypothetical protein